jgi:raffinose synthase
MPETHGAHLYTNAQVGLWFGEFMHPDWDMFQSHHEWGAFHAAGRAISGGPVYVSDRPQETRFDVLRKLVCSDGSVLRCPAPALPTLDCLTVDPTREDVLLKIWNRNGERGVVGVFNARYRGPERIQGRVSPTDVPGLTEGIQRVACFCHQAQRLAVLSTEDSLDVSLAEGQFELFTFAPILGRCAPIGLINMLNTGAAIESITWLDADTCELIVRDHGELWIWAAEAPRDVAANGLGCTFGHDRGSGAVRIALEQAGQQQVVLRW